MIDESDQHQDEGHPAFFLGIDWGGKEHALCLLDSSGKKLGECKVKHSAAGIEQAQNWLRKRVGSDLAVLGAAMETPHGALPETLLDAGARVYSINPKQSDRFRDRHTVAGSKDDRRDAFVLADALRTDGHCFRQLEARDSQLVLLRELTRKRISLDRTLHRSTNRVREALQRVWPELLTLSPGANEPWLWSLLERAPSPAQGRRLSVTTLTKVLRSHRIRRFSAHDLRTAVQQPLLPVAPGVSEAFATNIALELPVIRTLDAQVKHAERQIAAILRQLESAPPKEGCAHRDVTILSSLTGAGDVVAASILAEAPEALSRRDYHAIAALGGALPVTRQSGRQRLVVRRLACNPWLRDAFYYLANEHKKHDPISQELYLAARARGLRRGGALRIVICRVLRILMAMLASNTLYSPPTSPVSTGEKALAQP
jgi:transposase